MFTWMVQWTNFAKEVIFQTVGAVLAESHDVAGSTVSTCTEGCSFKQLLFIVSSIVLCIDYKFQILGKTRRLANQIVTALHTRFPKVAILKYYASRQSVANGSSFQQ